MAGDVPWYRKYPTIVQEAKELRVLLDRRCSELGLDATRLVSSFDASLIARIVHESNWQEGIELPLGRTRELTDEMEVVPGFKADARLDIEAIVTAHRERVFAMKRVGASIEELAAANLARAHRVMLWIGEELAGRQAASLAHALLQLRLLSESQPELKKRLSDPALARGMNVVDRLLASSAPIHRPLLGVVATEGDLLKALLNEPVNDLLSPMSEIYIHALHRIVLAGIMPSNRIGRWRTRSVHVGNPDLVLPPPQAVPSLMAEYVRDFPTILPTTVQYDVFLAAAKASWRFVRIHPYSDGNGRISRLIMNLVLWGHHPIVSVASRAKGRHRYRVAIRRADRGDLVPLATLIAAAVRDAYSLMLSAIQSP